jgi:hypothetical protein
MRLLNNPNSTAGKMTVSILIAGFAVFLVLFSFDLQHEYVVQQVQAQDYATTTVFVLNTPPQWTVDAQEDAPGSATSTPTNATSSLDFIATATDANGEDYFLIICSTSAAATANNEAPPTCSGGAGNTWAVSPTTTSGTVATATYTTLVSDAERNEWWASVCDAPALPATPECNTDIQQGDKANDTATSSPFHVNHRPDFTVASNTGPVDPGDTISFTSTSSDTDTLGSDTIQLFVCKTQDFDYTNLLCPGGAWATSTSASQDVSTSTTIVIPTQDTSYDAYFYIVDSHGFAALEEPDEPGSAQATNSPYTVNNVAPTVATSTINLEYGGPIVLTTPEGQTTGFTLTFTVRDNNSCEAFDTSDEFESAVVGIYRSGELYAGCDEAADFDTNHCYHTATGTDGWAYSIAATTTDTCDGADDLTRDYEFTFPLWYNADPTAGAGPTDSTWWDEYWIAAVVVDDDDFATSTVSTSTDIVELNPLAAFDIVETSINFGSLEPGNTTTPVLGAPSGTTTIRALGNVGVDQNLLGEDMCPYYQTFGDCWTYSSTSTVGAEQQRYSTTTITYDQATTDGNIVSSTTVSELEVNVPKTTSTSSPATGIITWGIAIPGSISFSGDYYGQNTFQVVQGEAEDW